MIGSLIGVSENIAKIRITLDLSQYKNLINLYVVIEERDSTKIVGEIIKIENTIADVLLLGEIKNDKFVEGVINKPSFSATIKLISEERIPMIIGIENYIEEEHLLIGKSPIYKNVNIGVKINDFFSSHFSIFGSTGSGKSCSVARIIQNLFNKQTKIPYRSSIFMFDAYGEYHQAFKDINTTSPYINFKSYTTNLNFDTSATIKIPLWLMDIDDIALILGADDVTQLPIIEQALKLVNVFGREESEVLSHKNDIISRALVDILTSGRPPAQIRDQIFSVLSHYNTRDLNLETKILQTGYTRPLKQLLVIDATGKIREMESLIEFFNSYLVDDLKLDLPDGTFKYTLEDLSDAFDFALIREGSLQSDKIFDRSNSLRVRLHTLASSKEATYFTYPEYISREMYIRELISTESGRKAQIINFNISSVDDRLAKTITKIFSKLLFNYNKETIDSKLPFHIILEEAHRYVQNDSDTEIIGYNIFDRITKEGRKYGVLMGFISQRPSELSETALSQCNNFLIFKMIHPKDVNYIKQMVPNVTEEIIKKLKILHPGTCVAFGGAFKLPVIINIEMPYPEPSSNSSDISNMWFVNNNENH